MAYQNKETVYINTYKKSLTRITKKQAEKLYNEGKKVYITPSKMKLESAWFTIPFYTKNMYDESFTSLTNNIVYYTDSSMGKTLHYYKEV